MIDLHNPSDLQLIFGILVIATGLGMGIGGLWGCAGTRREWIAKLKTRGLITHRRDGTWKWAGTRETIE